jgi:hypothetical protein
VVGAHFVHSIDNPRDKVIGHSSKRFIEDQEQIILIRHALVNEFKEQELTLNSTEAI